MATKNTKYVDGFLMVVPKKNFAEYRKMAQWGRKVWLKYGALDYKECVGDDIDGLDLLVQKMPEHLQS